MIWEALALTKDDIDLMSSHIKALCFDGNNAYIKEPKSQRGYRRTYAGILARIPCKATRKYQAIISLLSRTESNIA